MLTTPYHRIYYLEGELELKAEHNIELGQYINDLEEDQRQNNVPKPLARIKTLEQATQPCLKPITSNGDEINAETSSSNILRYARDTGLGTYDLEAIDALPLTDLPKPFIDNILPASVVVLGGPRQRC
jgi:hypothetical protein